MTCKLFQPIFETSWHHWYSFLATKICVTICDLTWPLSIQSPSMYWMWRDKQFRVFVKANLKECWNEPQFPSNSIKHWLQTTSKFLFYNILYTNRPNVEGRSRILCDRSKHLFQRHLRDFCCMPLRALFWKACSTS